MYTNRLFGQNRGRNKSLTEPVNRIQNFSRNLSSQRLYSHYFLEARTMI